MTIHKLISGALAYRGEFQASRGESGAAAGPQRPFALFIACSDSRVVPEVLTKVEPGNIFVIRNAGNIIPSYGPTSGGVSASIEYGIGVLGIEHLIVCGHTDCGAMKAILQADNLGKMPAVEAWIRHSAAARHIVDAVLCDADDPTRLNALVHENVTCQLRNLQTHPIVAARIATGKLTIYGWVYDVASGGIDTFDVDRGAFVPLTEKGVVHATPRTKVAYPALDATVKPKE